MGRPHHPHVAVAAPHTAASCCHTCWQNMHASHAFCSPVMGNSAICVITAHAMQGLPPDGAATTVTAAPLLQLAERTSPSHDEFTVLEQDGRTLQEDPPEVSAGSHGSQDSFDSEAEDAENAENAGVPSSVPRPRPVGAMLRTLEDRPDEMIKWEYGSEAGSEREPGGVSAPTSPLRRGGSSGLGALTPAGSPLRNQSPHHGRPPLSPNKVLPVSCCTRWPLFLQRVSDWRFGCCLVDIRIPARSPAVPSCRL